MRGHFFALGCAALFLLVACAEASTDQALGGDLKVDGTPPPAPPTPPAPPSDAGPNVTFTDLYLDLFGPVGAASCSAGGGSCHGTATPPGGFACGSNKSECRTSVAARAAGPAFKSSSLFRVLRKSPGDVGLVMPQAPTFVFDGPTLNRIAAWAEAGAKDD